MRLLANAIVAQREQALPAWAIQSAWLPGAQPRPPVQLTLWGWGADHPNPQYFLSLEWTTRAQHNVGHVSVPHLDASLALGDGMSDQAARIPSYQQAELLLITEGAAIPLYQNF